MSTGRLGAGDTAIQPTIFDAKADILTATAADTPARLAVGANGTVLTADSAEATGLKWATPAAGSLTLLSTTSMSGVNTVTVSSISQSYKGLAIWADDIQSTDNNIDMRVNGSSSAIYKTLGLGSNNISVGTLATSLQQIIQLQSSTQSGFFRMLCWGYTETASQKIIVNNAHGRNSGGAGAVYNQANYINVGAINSVTFFTADTAANFTQGTIKIYGVN